MHLRVFTCMKLYHSLLIHVLQSYSIPIIYNYISINDINHININTINV